MARTVRDSRLESREARLRLKPRHEPYWRLLHEGLHLGYRKGSRGGVWLLRAFHGGKYVKRSIASTDDTHEANGDDILDFRQAQANATEFANSVLRGDTQNGPYSVAQAIDDYLAWYAINKKAVHTTRTVCAAHIIPSLGNKIVSELTARQLRKWHELRAQSPARIRSGIAREQRFRETRAHDADALRKRKSSANRVLTILKAALNYAWREHKVPSNEAWASVKPFRNVDAPKIRYLSVEESTRLINACSAEFRPLVTAALLTGCRYGELIAMRCNDFNADAGTVLVRESKNGKPRHVPLTDEGQRFFERLAVGHAGSEIMFTKANGTAWRKSHQSRPLKEACKIAKITPAVSFHDLRHTYASALAMKGVPLQVIAEALGHSDTRITGRHYAHLLPSFVADTIRKHLPNFGVQHDNVTALNR